MTIQRTAIYALALCGINSSLVAQATSGVDPFPGGIAEQDHFDLSRTLFPSPEAERQQRAEALATAARAAALAVSASSSAAGLLRMLRTADSAQGQLSRHYAYLTLLPAMDRRNDSANRDFGALAGTAQRSLSTVDATIRAMDAPDPRCEWPLSSREAPQVATPSSLTAAPADPIAYIKLRTEAVSLASKRQMREVLPLAEQLVRQYPCDAYTWRMLGGARFAAGQFAAAAEAYERAMEIWGPGTPGWNGYSLAVAHARAGNRKAALDVLEQLVFHHGFARRPQLYGDSNLASLQTDPRFLAIAGRVDTTGWSRNEGWRRDLDHLVKEVRRLDPPYRQNPLPAEFTRLESALRRDIPKLSDEEIFVGLARLVASLRQGHTGMFPTNSPRLSFTQLPVDLWAFPEGLFIVKGAGGASDLVGGQLLTIEKTPALEALRQVGETHTHESGMQTLWTGPLLVRMAQTLKGLGIAPRTDRINVTVRLRSGETVQRELATVPMGTSVKLVPPPGVTPPLFLRNVPEFQWSERLSDNTLFVQMNQVLPDPDQSIADFGLALRRTLQEQPIRNVILDLRNNNGGNSFLYPELLRTLIQFSADDRNRLYVMIGRWTYSAAANLAADLQRLGHPIFVGEPTSATGNQWGDNGDVILPWSGLPVSITNLRWQLSDPWDKRPNITPHMPVQLTAEAYLAGRDPALEAIQRLIAAGGLPPGEMDPRR